MYYCSSSLINKINFNIIIWGLLLGVVFYDLISEKLGFTYVDEIFVLFLFLYCVIRMTYSIEFLVFILIAFFYLFYSYVISVTTGSAILTDFFIQIKPFLAFYCAYNLRLSVAQEYKSFVSMICLCLAICFIPVGLLGENFILSLGSHPSRFCSAISILGVLYLYSSTQTRWNTFIAIIIWSIGLLCGKGKFIGFYIVALFLLVIHPSQSLKISFKTIALAILSVTIVLLFTWGKIDYYFIDGSEAENSFARPVLYINMVNVLADYPLFGSGLGTYATHASAIYYSPLYFKYGLDLNYEIGNGRFITDTFYPSLAQFGCLGIILFLYFWYRIYKKGKESESFKMILLIISYFVIESVADATFTQNRGLYMMMLLAMILSKKHPQKIVVHFNACKKNEIPIIDKL